MAKPDAPPATQPDLLDGRSILVVDDDPAVRNVLAKVLQSRGWRVLLASSGADAIDAYARDQADIVLLDVQLGDFDGVEVLRRLRETDPDVTVVMLSGMENVEIAVAAMREGAENYLSKPFDAEHLCVSLDRALEKSHLRRRVKSFAKRQVRDADFATLGDSPAMKVLVAEIVMLAGGDAPVLLMGETGSGKGWAAKLIHAASARKSGPFIAVNCAGLSATFLHTELFGHEAGAFTDGKTRKEGLFELADGGTIMLDEIGDLAQELQPKLLTVLETNRFRRLGGTQEIQVDVRVIAATHANLAEAVKAGRFRSDLFYRLAVFPLRIPALRERGQAQIADLAMRLLASLHRKLGRGPAKISTEALAMLVAYGWPGNVREMQNVLERALVLAGDEDELLPAHLPADIRATRITGTRPGGVQSGASLSGDLSLAAAERRHIENVLQLTGWNLRRAAQMLGISRQTLYNRLSEYGIERGE